MGKRFPRTESDIATLAGRVIDGLTNAAEDFPAPPVSSEELRGKLDAFQASDTATVAAETAFRNQHAEKDEVLEELVDALKADLRYAEIAVRDAPQKLNALGWRHYVPTLLERSVTYLSFRASHLAERKLWPSSAADQAPPIRSP
jgi:hypothetical protein